MQIIDYSARVFFVSFHTWLTCLPWTPNLLLQEAFTCPVTREIPLGIASAYFRSRGRLQNCLIKTNCQTSLPPFSHLSNLDVFQIIRRDHTLGLSLLHVKFVYITTSTSPWSTLLWSPSLDGRSNRTIGMVASDLTLLPSQYDSAN